MTEHKLSEQEMQEIREEAEKLYPLRGILGLNNLEIKAHIAAATAERLRAKGLYEALESIQNICLREYISDEQMQRDFKLIFEITDDTLLNYKKANHE